MPSIAPDQATTALRAGVAFVLSACDSAGLVPSGLGADTFASVTVYFWDLDWPRMAEVVDGLTAAGVGFDDVESLGSNHLSRRGTVELDGARWTVTVVVSDDRRKDDAA
jgi:hypothetical protein